jgi:hypothetical protein
MTLEVISLAVWLPVGFGVVLATGGRGVIPALGGLASLWLGKEGVCAQCRTLKMSGWTFGYESGRT